MINATSSDRQLADMVWMMSIALRAGYPIHQVFEQLAASSCSRVTADVNRIFYSPGPVKDVTVEHKDVPQIRSLLEARGYQDVPRDDTRDCNFMPGDDQVHLVDIHSCTFDE